VSVTVRPARVEDCEDLAAFRQKMEGGRVLAELRGPAFYRHKYVEVGVASVAEDKGRIVGMTAGSPRRITFSGRTVMAADLGDLFIAPDYRGHGLFRRLHDSTLAALKQRGVQVVTVQPGPPAVPALSRAFGYVPLFPIAEWMGIVDRKRAVGSATSTWRRWLLRVLPSLVARPAPPGIEVEVGSAAGLEGPPPSAQAWPKVTTLRDAAWLEARYASGPTPYEAAVARGDGMAAVVFLVQRPLPGAAARGWLVDGWAAGPAAHRLAVAVVSRVTAEFRARGVAIAHTWSAQGAAGSDTFVRGIRNARFVRQPLQKRLFGWAEPGAGIVFPPGSQWMFRMGDTDGI
jgi:GNAT superfamily N-acetyltransferase